MTVMSFPQTTSRRGLLKMLAAGAAPLILPHSRVFGQDAASKKITVACIGVGWMGGANLESLLAIGDCRVVAICDVDAKHLEEAVNRVNSQYGNKDCKGYKDFREVVARADIDAVAISTPDHWHAIIAVAAARAGKDVFCEKPLTHTLGEGVLVAAEAQKHNIIWQTGSWQRSQAKFRWAAQLVQNGYLGKVTRVEVGLPNGHSDFHGTGNNQPDGTPPQEVDFDFWTGPAKMMPFNPCRFHKNWRWNYNYGGGQLMDWIGHHCDIAHWGLANPEFGCGPDNRIGPVEVKATAAFPPKDAIWNTATEYRVECKYPNQVDLIIAGGHPDIGEGAKWIGPNGWVKVNRAKIEASDVAWLRDIQAREKKGDLKIQLYQSPGHFPEFIASIKSRKETLTPVAVAQRSQTPGHLGYIASVLGRPIRWNAETQEIIGDPEATAMTVPNQRGEWKL
jgi:predicted dehydrogenase